MALTEQLNRINNKTDDLGVLTIYLNTESEQGEWKIRLKNGTKRLEEYAEKSDDKESKKALKKLLGEANTHIHDQQMNMQKSFVLIASADGDIWIARTLQVPVETSFHWEKQADTGQLEDLQERYPATGVIVTQQRDVTLIDTALGEVRDEKKFSWDLEKEDWVDYEDQASPPSAADTSVDDFQRRFEENKQRWYKKLAPVLTRELKKRNLTGSYFVGSKETVSELTQHISDSYIKGKIAKNLGSKPAHEIVNQVYGENVR
ncbi:VLRF1 family aeRF1-type release factor [Natribacillus halophilus]|uniref:Protein required for attachment to host cells n=1 Tax=Natribacillus halophilus TaxID=549003 RepID=A0A1G8R555_9BACI|nr:VLRF1 family aeRF1-type release factor [Natribacillus halophilus]SDJ11540.1 hypothetical protein SAMN04488123_11544 [Natribacillus halophilus]